MILRDDCLNTPDLARIARLDKMSHSLVLPNIYKYVSLNFALQGQMSPLSPRTNLFRRTILESPSIAALTSGIFVLAHHIQKNSWDYYIKSLIRNLPSLRDVWLETMGDYDDLLDPATLSNVRNLTIHHRDLNSSRIFSYMFLPNIETLKLTGLLLTIAPVDPRSLDSQATSLKVLSLYIENRRIRGLLFILPCCVALTHLTCSINYDKIFTGCPHPTIIAGALENCRQTLVSLELTCHPRSNADQMNKPILDVTEFPNLKALRTDATLLFDQHERYNIPARNRFYTRLPSSLESLEVRASCYIEPSSMNYPEC